MRQLMSVFLMCSSLFSQSLNPSDIIYLAKTSKNTNLKEMFNAQPTMSLADAKRFLEDTYAIIKYKYPNASKLSMNELKHDVMEFIKYEMAGSKLKDKVENSMNVLIDYLIESDQKQSAALDGSASKELLNNKRKKRHKKLSRYELSYDNSNTVVNGSVETVCGALLWLIPLRQVGADLMKDGVQQMLHAASQNAKPQKKPKLTRKQRLAALSAQN